jgi:hypothetical protein
MRADYNYIAVTVLHLSRREFYRMNPGIFFDMVQLNNERYKKKTDPNEDE